MYLYAFLASALVSLSSWFAVALVAVALVADALVAIALVRHNK
jgi:hypothetical protein